MTLLKSFAIGLSILLLASNTYAQSITPGDHPIADYVNSVQFHNTVSWVTVGANIGLDTLHSFESDNKKKAFLEEGLSGGMTLLATTILKHFVHEERPDHSGNDSFPSGHTATAGAFSGYYYPAGITFTVVTGIERYNAKKHWPKDVVIGGILGTGDRILAHKIANKLIH